MPIAELPARGVVAVSGPDARPFLQGLVSNDVARVGASETAVWAALLTPQGKWLADFFLLADGERILLECERAQAAWLASHLARYRLRAKVDVADESDRWTVFAAWRDGAPVGLAARDPRLPEAGWRCLASPGALRPDATAEDYDHHRLALGLPEGSRDLESGRTVLLEAGFDELNGISWTKGCWMGQELTARTKYRGLVKKRLVPVRVEGPLPAPGTPVLRDGAEVGTIRSGREDRALAFLRLDALAGPEPLMCGEARLRPAIPAWMRLPAESPA
ncbi:CAF17-like 4Fe-4S cluster assembly/insertion protein YgfZ [Elioraea thermophila]|uniref:CAF17-like 4Fe-4S cluster assembly/insertion protein YgfZ n=1 Tax=Elioraea thermophila TaxID=2185104 RepID=UPI000DF4BB36|nr:folate-binding protein YgfZ [Elioraea thermophila]